MNNLLEQFLSIPITHTLLALTATTICTIVATEQHFLMELLAVYIIIGSYAIIKNHSILLIYTLCFSMCSILTIARIQQQYTQYRSHQKFLKISSSVHGTIEQINRNSLIKDQATVIVQTKNIFTPKNTLHIPKKIALFFPSEHVKNLEENSTITVHNIKLEQAQDNSDYQRYLIKEGFWAIAHCTMYTNYETQCNNPNIQQKILFNIKKQLHAICSSLFDPLFLGKKEKNMENLSIQHRSVYWGIAHHMARSGAHLAILFGLIMLLLHYTQLPYLIRYFLCIFLLLGYAGISQSSISFLRALFMILLNIIGRIFKHIPSSLHTLTITTLATLLLNPMQLFFLDFQLSFGITYIIVWLFNIKNSKTIAFYRQRLVHF